LQSATQKKKFRPGELAPITGIYLVMHGTGHRDPHEVVVIRGEQLPTCRTCKVNLLFEIVRPVSHITHDWDFSGPYNLVVRPKQQDFADFRMFRRMAIQLPITLHFASSTSTIVFRGHSSDLSAGGLAAVIRDRMPSQVRTGVVKIDTEPGRKALALRAQLRYQTGARCGFEFTNVSTAERQAIRRLMEAQKHSSAQVGD
jgi:hypothetical protein